MMVSGTFMMMLPALLGKAFINSRLFWRLAAENARLFVFEKFGPPFALVCAELKRDRPSPVVNAPLNPLTKQNAPCCSRSWRKESAMLRTVERTAPYRSLLRSWRVAMKPTAYCVSWIDFL